MRTFRRMRVAAITSVTGLFLACLIDMFAAMSWARDLMSPWVNVPIYVISYAVAPRVAKLLDE